MDEQVLKDRFLAIKALLAQLPGIEEFVAKEGDEGVRGVFRAIVENPDYGTACKSLAPSSSLTEFLRGASRRTFGLYNVIHTYCIQRPLEMIKVFADTSCTVVLCLDGVANEAAVLHRKLTEAAGSGDFGPDTVNAVWTLLDQRSYGVAVVIVGLAQQLANARAELAEAQQELGRAIGQLQNASITGERVPYVGPGVFDPACDLVERRLQQKRSGTGADSDAKGDPSADTLMSPADQSHTMPGQPVRPRQPK